MSKFLNCTVQIFRFYCRPTTRASTQRLKHQQIAALPDKRFSDALGEAQGPSNIGTISEEVFNHGIKPGRFGRIGVLPQHVAHAERLFDRIVDHAERLFDRIVDRIEARVVSDFTIWNQIPAEVWWRGSNIHR